MEIASSRFRLVARLGAGGLGEVWQAQDLQLGRTVALKFLSSPGEHAANTWAPLLAEARMAARLSHPHIATIHEAVETDRPFIVMEYVAGETLRDRIAKGPFGIEQALDLGTQVARALEAAHHAGCLHCDLTTSNVIVGPDGRVKVLDFGLARWKPRTTIEGAGNGHEPSTGTLRYMSPEQLRGDPLDERTDLFSLGVLLYEMVAGRRPFDGGTPSAVARALLHEEPAPLSAHRDDVPLELESLVRRALEKDRSRRYAAAGTIARDLEAIRDSLGPGRAARASGTPTTAAATPKTAVPGRPGLATGWWRAWSWWRFGSRRPGPLSAVPEGAAFRGLVPFQEADRDRFFGRAAEVAALSDRLQHDEFRFGILFGDSGSGKTSLLRAGLLPRLWEQGLVPLYCRSYKDPLHAVVEECRKRTQMERRDGEPPIDYLRRVARAERLVLIWDQFEELFVNFRSPGERESFVSFVAACHDSADVPLRCLFSIRSDFLHLIGSEFEGHVPDPLKSARLFRLRSFDAGQAAEIIEASVLRAGVPFEPGLSHHVARDLAVGGTVLPSELQIVGERLQARRIFTVAAYTRTGGKESLVHSFLDDVIRSSGHAEAAGLLLRSLISDDNTRLTLPLDEIVRRTQGAGAVVARVLRVFVDSRLVREIQDDEPWRYELMHEYLIDRINHVTGKVMDATQRANRLFRQALAAYAVDKRTRLPLTQALFVGRHSDLERGDQERALLRRSVRRGLAMAAALGFVVAVIALGAAAALSITDEWEGVRLSDGHSAAVRRLALSPDGRRLASCGEDNAIIVWDYATRQRLATLTEHTGFVTALAYSPDGRWLVSGSHDGSAIVWDAARLTREAVLERQAGAARALSFSPDGGFLASAGGERTLLWQTHDWVTVQELAISVGDGCDLLFSKDGRELYSPSGHKALAIASGKEVLRFLDDFGSVAALSPDGRTIAGVNPYGIVTFGDVQALAVLARHRAHRDHGRAAAYSPDGRLAATAAEDIVLWDAATRHQIGRLEHPSIVWDVVFTSDGRLVSAHGDGAILLWDLKEQRKVAAFNGHSAPVRSVAFTRDGSQIVSGSDDRSVIVWDAEHGRKQAVLAGHATRVTSVASGPPSAWLASTDQDGHGIVWDAATHAPRLKLPPSSQASAYAVAISPTGESVATSHGLYETTQGRQLLTFENPSAVYALAFSRDGRLLAQADTTVRSMVLWDPDRRHPLGRIDPKESTPIAIGFSPDGESLVTANDQGTLRLWRVAMLQDAGVLGQHTARVRSVSFSPDGRFVASASDDQSLGLWDVARRRLVTHVGTHTAPVLSVAFSPDGRRLVAGSHDSSVRLYTRHRTLWGRRLD